jgi:hypothetical protein
LRLRFQRYNLPTKVRIAAPERAFEGSVEDGCADVDERLYRLLLLDHPARHDFITALSTNAVEMG